MNGLTRLFGLPHEALHALALILIGRRAVKFTRTHVIIPNDLTQNQFIFVAGLPFAVFLLIFIVGGVSLLNAGDLRGVLIALIAVLIGGLGCASASGDLVLIWERMQEQS